jgi:tetratricopeptide (TPR) repeat protein
MVKEYRYRFYRYLLSMGVVSLSVLLTGHSCHAQGLDEEGAPGEKAPSGTVYDPLDPFDYLGSDELFAGDDKDKSAEQLILEGERLLQTERLVDGRTKLLKALQKDPNQVDAYTLLAGYYMVHVGHFRLSMKYIKQAEALFLKQNGAPPYSTRKLQQEHSRILYFISQGRLNLDNYQGSLDALDQFTSNGYYAEWYPGSRAWVLMKLGRLPEAIRVARLGILTEAEPGRTLNMLGILLSMNDQRQEAIEVFRKAIAFEMSQGSEGQPATPLNNVGEVFREMFEDDKAESQFLRAVGLKDGCEHVLPTLNVVLLYIEQLKLDAAASAIDGFQRCMAQFPLRNGEEYSALVSLARGRIDLHSGHIDRAIGRFEAALEGTQWFGKIGTNQDDLIAAATLSLGQALLRKNSLLETYRPISWGEWYRIKEERLSNSFRSWWLLRRARQVLIDNLNDLEDISIRNTDSLLEYPTLGEALAGFSRSAVMRRIEKQRREDSRPQAQTFYSQYLAESSLGWWNRSEGASLLDSVIQVARPKYDELLKVQASIYRMKLLDSSSDRYHELAYRVLIANPAALRNHGLKLPVSLDASAAAKALRSTLISGPFEISNNSKAECSIRAASDTDGKHRLVFSCRSVASKNKVAQDNDPNAVVNKLADSIFEEEISNGGNS